MTGYNKEYLEQCAENKLNGGSMNADAAVEGLKVLNSLQENTQAGQWFDQNSKKNQEGKKTRLPPPDRTRRGLTEEEWKSQHKALEFAAFQAHKGEIHKPLPAWISRIGEYVNF